MTFGDDKHGVNLIKQSWKTQQESRLIFPYISDKGGCCQSDSTDVIKVKEELSLNK